MTDLYKKFIELNRNINDSQYPLCFSGAIKCYYGINKDGFYRISFLSSSSLNISGKTKGIEIVEGFSSENNYWTCFDLKNDDLLPVFCTFGEDLVSCIYDENNENIASNNLRMRYKTWVALFKKSRNPLSPEKTQGLYGELYFLKNFMVPTYGVIESVNAWGGPDQNSKDFSINNTWFEIKTVGTSSAVVKISSMQQLSSDESGSLVINRVEGMSDAFNGKDCSINNLIQSIISDIGDQGTKDDFLEKISNYGYDFCDDAGNKKFQVASSRKYIVDKTFPALRENEIKSDAINNVSYELIISLLKAYESEN